MECLVANIAGKTRREWLNGREHIVAPVVLITPGVLNGSQGPLYYPASEVSKNPSIWNWIPLVKDHPRRNRGYVMVQENESVLNEEWFGFLYNTHYDGKLRAEAWFDVERTRATDLRIIEALNSSQPIELSTGLRAKQKPAPDGATFNGRIYHHEAVDYRPDHLAILLDVPGACSVKDGCGVLVNQEAESYRKYMKKAKERLTGEKTVNDESGEQVVNDASHSQIHIMLAAELAKRFTQSDPHAYVDDVYDDYFIYCQADKKYRLGYSKTEDDMVKLDKTPVEVRREVEYVPVANSNRRNPPEDAKMSKLADDAKKKIVDDLITNCGCSGMKPYKEENRETLNGLPDEILIGMDANRKALAEKETVAALNSANEKANNGNPKTPETSVKTINEMSEADLEAEIAKRKTAKVTANQGQFVIKREPLTDEEFWEMAPASVRNQLNRMKEQDDREKSDLIEKIVANVAKEDLEGRVAYLTKIANQDDGLDQLREMAKFIPEKRRQPSFAGAGGSGTPLFNKFDPNEDAEMDPPVINWAEEAKLQRERARA